MSSDSRESVFERRYKEQDQKILEHVKNDVYDQEQFFAKLDLLKLQQAKIAEILTKQEQEEAKLTEEKRQEIFGDDPVYQKVKASWDEELLQKFHDRRLTRWEYLKLSKTHKLDLWEDCYYDQTLERFDQVFRFKCRFAKVRLGKKFGFINEQWKEICECKYDQACYFKGNFARVKIGDKRGFINEHWEEICKLMYDQVWDFEGRVAQVRIGNKRGLINEQWEQICEAMYDEIFPFRNGFAEVRIGDKRGFINEQWEQIWEVKYDYVCHFKGGFAEVRIGGKRGLINEQWKEICEIIYDEICRFGGGVAQVKIGDKRVSINVHWEFFDKLPQ